MLLALLLLAQTFIPADCCRTHGCCFEIAATDLRDLGHGSLPDLRHRRDLQRTQVAGRSMVALRLHLRQYPAEVLRQRQPQRRAASTLHTKEPNMQIIDLNVVLVGARQRKKIDKGPLTELRESIRTKGLFHPPVVRQDSGGNVMLVVGRAPPDAQSRS